MIMKLKYHPLSLRKGERSTLLKMVLRLAIDFLLARYILQIFNKIQISRKI